MSGMEESHDIVQVYQTSIFKITLKDESNGQIIKIITKKLNIKGGEANQGVTCDSSIFNSDELELQSNFYYVILVKFPILLHHCQCYHGTT